MYGSELQELEQLMMLVPNFLPRRSGVIVVQRIRNEPEFLQHGNCRKRITDYCATNKSYTMSEQITAGDISYEELLARCFENSDSYSLKKRLADLIRKNDGEFFLNPIHESRFNTICRFQNQPIESRTTTYLATLFLLTADDKLWCAAKDYVYLDSFDFKRMHLNGINTDGYALFQMAKTLQRGQEYIKLNEISDKHLIGDRAFKAIIHSVLITKYGAVVLQMKS
ncbi:hypothetical protein Q5O24_09720 [Eubacteriaceae bacterium ES3]|nr:hypothetical protein Q5O24_09720 [Eubacteriaceae bacterium ES3]